MCQMLSLLETGGETIVPRNRWKMAALTTTMLLLTGHGNFRLEDPAFNEVRYRACLQWGLTI